MKLINPETNEEYEVVKEIGAGDGSGKNFVYEVKPVDSWPKEYWFINGDGDVRHIEENRHGIDENDKFLGIYRTKEQAEAAAERIMSLQGATAESCTPNGDGTWTIEVTIPKKYLKAWKELSDE